MNTIFNRGDLQEFGKFCVEHYVLTGDQNVTKESVVYWQRVKELQHRHKDFVLELTSPDEKIKFTLIGLRAKEYFNLLCDCDSDGVNLNIDGFEFNSKGWALTASGCSNAIELRKHFLLEGENIKIHFLNNTSEEAREVWEECSKDGITFEVCGLQIPTSDKTWRSVE